VLGFSQIPFFRIVLCFGLGMACQQTCRISISILFAILTLLLISVLWLRYYKVAFVLRILLLSFGISILGAIILENRQSDIDDYPLKSNLSTFLVKKQLATNKSWTKYEIQADDVGLLYVHTGFEILKVGTYYSSGVQKYKIQQDALPKRFDYPLFLKSKGYLFTSFIKESDTIFKSNSYTWFLRQMDEVRNAVAERMDVLLEGKNIKGFYSAVLLGDKSWLDEETQSAFATLGISHFLAVSGLHVGIIYLVFSLVLGLNKYKKHRWFIPKIILVVVIIWFYALLSGLSVSVVRAAFMFSCFLIARSIKRSGNGFNILCFSAFVNLVINPFAFYDVGFQLSYAAVASIILLYPKMQSVLAFKYKIMNLGWDAVCISTCAQLGTLPIILYTFGYFPVWFLVSNLWLALFSFVLTLSAFLFLFLSFVPIVNDLYAFLVELLYDSFLWGVQQLEFLPFSQVLVFISQYQMLVLLSMIGLWFTYIYSRKRSALLFGIFLAVIVLIEVDDGLQPVFKTIDVGYKRYYVYESGNRKWMFPQRYTRDFDSLFVKNNADQSLFNNYYRLPRHIRPNKKHEMIVLRIVNSDSITIETELK
jgi:competence protein ComEC